MATAEQAGTPALPALPRQRILLALRQAIAHHNQVMVAAIVQAGQREQPDWDPTAELDRLQRRRSLATLAAPADVPAVPGPHRPPEAGAPWLTRPWLRGAGWPAA